MCFKVLFDTHVAECEFINKKTPTVVSMCSCKEIIKTSISLIDPQCSPRWVNYICLQLSLGDFTEITTELGEMRPLCRADLTRQIISTNQWLSSCFVISPIPLKMCLSYIIVSLGITYRVISFPFGEVVKGCIASINYCSSWLYGSNIYIYFFLRLIEHSSGEFSGLCDDNNPKCLWISIVFVCKKKKKPSIDRHYGWQSQLLSMHLAAAGVFHRHPPSWLDDF